MVAFSMYKWLLVSVLSLSLSNFAPVFSASVDYPKLAKSIQEEICTLWFKCMIQELERIHDMKTIKQWEEYEENFDCFDALFEAATLDENQKVLLGYVVYAKRYEFWTKMNMALFSKMLKEDRFGLTDSLDDGQKKRLAEFAHQGFDMNPTGISIERIEQELEKYGDKIEFFKDRAKKLGMSEILDSMGTL